MTTTGNATCSTPGCDRPTHAFGLCHTHYTGHRRKHGTTPCSESGCTRPAIAKGRCDPHYRRSLLENVVCSVEGCEGQAFGRGMCSTHYSRVMRTGDPGPAEKLRRPARPCRVQGCSNKSISRDDLCPTHYQRKRLYGNPDGTLSTTKVCVRTGCDDFVVATVRSNDYCREHYVDYVKALVVAGELSGERAAAGYVYHSVFKKRLAEHSIIMESMIGRPLVKGENVHHKNGDRSDNRPENLELWSSFQPVGQRAADKLAYAREIIRLYGDLPPESLG